jgi:hypothetical protein
MKRTPWQCPKCDGYTTEYACPRCKAAAAAPVAEYTPRPLTISRSTVDPDRYALTYEATEHEPASSHDLVTWHDAVMALEFQRPRWRTARGSNAPTTRVIEILDAVRHPERSGEASWTIGAEPRPV